MKLHSVRMKRIIIASFILLLYLVPSPYLCMLIDYRYRTASGYILFFILSVLLAIIATKFKIIYSFIIGNIITYLTSFYYINPITDDWWTGFFKPVLPITMALILVIISLLLQAITVIIIRINKLKRPPA